MSDLYKQASDILVGLDSRKGGLKTLAYANSVSNKKSSFALVCETLKYKEILEEILLNSQFDKENKNLKQRNLILVMLYDLLFGRGDIQGGGQMKKLLMKYHNPFKAALVRSKIKRKVKNNIDLLPLQYRSMTLVPRYARVNTLKTTIEEVKQLMLTDHRSVYQDNDLNSLLVFPPGTDLHDHKLVKNGHLILQDKASCFPAHILYGERLSDGDVIDACAAPGNKTSHLAMLVPSQSKVFAFDRSPKRLDLLKERMKEANATSVEPCLQSFLDVDTHDPKYANVRSILLDPSCSGSGMQNRLDHLLETTHSNGQMDEQEKQRVTSLADFQLQALLKAFSFPQVERVTYSTCSLHQLENEDVVAKAIQHQTENGTMRPFVLRPCLPTWKRRGVTTESLSTEQSQCLVRADPSEDLTTGFFVAYFERSKENKRKREENNQEQPPLKEKKSRKKRKSKKKKEQQM